MESLRKKKMNEKESKGFFSDANFTVAAIDEELGHKYYTVGNKKYPRAELLNT